MTVEGAPRPIGIVLRSDMKNDRGNFAPISTFRIGIKDAQIGDQMLLVVRMIAGSEGARSATSGSRGGGCIGVFAVRF
jgi:hypothetical protein